MSGCLAFGDGRGGPDPGVSTEQAQREGEIEEQRFERPGLQIGDGVATKDERTRLGAKGRNGEGVLARPGCEYRRENVDADEHESRDCDERNARRGGADDADGTHPTTRCEGLATLVELQVGRSGNRN